MTSVSIITVVKNNAVGLLKTLESARSQDFSDWELLIVYGESEDETFEVASKFCKLDNRFSLIEQSDRGIYEAMNLGVEESKSDFLWFMNSGDQFYSSKTLSYGFNSISNSQFGFMVGGYKIESQNRLFKQNLGELTQLKLALSRRGACHQAMIFRKWSLINSGGFDTKLSLAADYKLCLKIIANSGAARLPDVLAIMEPNGLSDRNLRRMHLEKHLIRREIFAKNLMAKVLGWCWMKAARTKATLKHLANGKEHPLV